jgi:hypothetical protein
MEYWNHFGLQLMGRNTESRQGTQYMYSFVGTCQREFSLNLENSQPDYFPIITRHSVLIVIETLVN